MHQLKGSVPELRLTLLNSHFSKIKLHVLCLNIHVFQISGKFVLTERNTIGTSGLRVTFDCDRETATRLEQLRSAKNKTKPPVMVIPQPEQPATSTGLTKVSKVVMSSSSGEAPPSTVVLSDGTVLVPVPFKQIKATELQKSASPSPVVTTVSSLTSTGSTLSQSHATLSQALSKARSHIKGGNDSQMSVTDPPIPLQLFRKNWKPVEFEDSHSLSANNNKTSASRQRKRKAEVKFSSDDNGSINNEELPNMPETFIKQEPPDYNSDGTEDSEINKNDLDISDMTEEHRIKAGELDFVIKTEPPDDFFDTGTEFSGATNKSPINKRSLARRNRDDESP